MRSSQFIPIYHTFRVIFTRENLAKFEINYEGSKNKIRAPLKIVAKKILLSKAIAFMVK